MTRPEPTVTLHVPARLAPAVRRLVDVFTRHFRGTVLFHIAEGVPLRIEEKPGGERGQRSTPVPG